LEDERRTTLQLSENIQIFFEALMMDAAKRLEFSKAGGDRISLYIHIEAHSYFVPCGRFSWDPVLKKKGRTTFPDNQGCISKAWRHDWHYDDKIPEDLELACTHHESGYDVPIEVTKNLKMRATLVAAKKILDRADGPIGVLVIESSRNERFEEGALKAKMVDIALYLGPIVDVLQEHIPTPQEAKSAGL
jgi:hypothetical protein